MMYLHILNCIIFLFSICSGQEIKVRFWGDKVEEVNDTTKSEVIAITSTTVRKFGSKSLVSLNHSIQ